MNNQLYVPMLKAKDKLPNPNKTIITGPMQQRLAIKPPIAPNAKSL